MPLNPKITVSTGGIHGNCWFANSDIPKGKKRVNHLMFVGEWLWKAGEWDFKSECVVPIETVQQWPEDVRENFLALAYQVTVSSKHSIYALRSTPTNTVDFLLA